MSLKRLARFQFFLTVVAMVWLAIWTAHAQEQRIDKLQDKIETNERRERDSAVALEARLTKIESTLNSLANWAYGIGGAVGLQVLNAGASHFFNIRQAAKKRRDTDP